MIITEVTRYLNEDKTFYYCNGSEGSLKISNFKKCGGLNKDKDKGEYYIQGQYGRIYINTMYIRLRDAFVGFRNVSRVYKKKDKEISKSNEVYRKIAKKKLECIAVHHSITRRLIMK